jgi:hypothetical protein
MDSELSVNRSQDFRAGNLANLFPIWHFKERMDNLIPFLLNAPKVQGADWTLLPCQMEWEAQERAFPRSHDAADDVTVRSKGLTKDYGLSIQETCG